MKFFFQVNIYAIAELLSADVSMSVESKELHEKVVLKPFEVNDNNETVGGMGMDNPLKYYGIMLL